MTPHYCKTVGWTAGILLLVAVFVWWRVAAPFSEVPIDESIVATVEQVPPSETSTSPAPTVPSVQIRDKQLDVVVVDTPAARTQGLSGTDSLTPGTGMLFVFPESDRHGIWMKDMHYAIDVVWISEAGRIVFIKEAFAPESYAQQEVATPPQPARYVLEVNAGVAAVAGWQVGDPVIIEGYLP